MRSGNSVLDLDNGNVHVPQEACGCAPGTSRSRDTACNKANNSKRGRGDNVSGSLRGVVCTGERHRGWGRSSTTRGEGAGVIISKGLTTRMTS